MHPLAWCDRVDPIMVSTPTAAVPTGVASRLAVPRAGAGSGAPLTPLTEAEVLAEARAMQLAPGGVVGQAQLLAALYRPDLEFDELGRLVAGDPALSARTLRVANSAFYRRSGEVGTVSRALQVLGMATVKGIAAAACLDRAVSAQAGAAGEEAKRLRRHSLEVACAAQLLARQVRPALEAEAFMCGVLHDIGMLVQWKLRAHQMAESRARGQLETAGASVGVSHERCGELLTHAWNLPEWLQTAIARHHHGELPAGDAGDLSTITRLAESMVGDIDASMTQPPAAAGQTRADSPNLAGRHAAELSRLALTPHHLERCLAELPAMIERFHASDHA